MSEMPPAPRGLSRSERTALLLGIPFALALLVAGAIMPLFLDVPSIYVRATFAVALVIIILCPAIVLYDHLVIPIRNADWKAGSQMLFGLATILLCLGVIYFCSTAKMSDKLQQAIDAFREARQAEMRPVPPLLFPLALRPRFRLRLRLRLQYGRQSLQPCHHRTQEQFTTSLMKRYGKRL